VLTSGRHHNPFCLAKNIFSGVGNLAAPLAVRREDMVFKTRALSAWPQCRALLNVLLYLGGGLFLFQKAERRARQKGLLGAF
jgi:hypothetical protein